MSIRDTIESVLKNGYVDHIHDNRRTVAIRRECERAIPTGRINLTLSDEQVDLLSSSNTNGEDSVVLRLNPEGKRKVSATGRGATIDLVNKKMNKYNLDGGIQWIIADSVITIVGEG